VNRGRAPLLHGLITAACAARELGIPAIEVDQLRRLQARKSFVDLDHPRVAELDNRSLGIDQLPTRGLLLFSTCCNAFLNRPGSRRGS
jgi:hypothetical protein